MATTTWTPTETCWGDLAHHEVMASFDGQLKTRAVALCVWKIAQTESATPYEIETLARRDRAIELRPDGTKIHAYAVKQARKILGLTAAAPPREKQKTTRRRKGKRVVTNALRRRAPEADPALQASAAVVDDFLNLSAEFATAQAAFAKAHQTLMALSRDHALTLAELETNAAQCLAREGLLKSPSVM